MYLIQPCVGMRAMCRLTRRSDDVHRWWTVSAATRVGEFAARSQALIGGPQWAQTQSDGRQRAGVLLFRDWRCGRLSCELLRWSLCA